MRKFVVVIIGIILMTASAEAAIISNGGFETGLSDWSASGNSGTTSFSNGYSPVEGSLFAYIYGTSSLTQSFSINSGETISGSAGFKSGDSLPYNDSASVDILDNNNSFVANLWNKNVASVGGQYGSSGWQSWNWTASTTGTYTLQLSVANVGDYIADSYAYFDGISGGTNPIPEPMSLSLLGLGLLGAMGAGIRSRKNK